MLLFFIYNYNSIDVTFYFFLVWFSWVSKFCFFPYFGFARKMWGKQGNWVVERNFKIPLGSICWLFHVAIHTCMIFAIMVVLATRARRYFHGLKLNILKVRKTKRERFVFLFFIYSLLHSLHKENQPTPV